MVRWVVLVLGAVLLGSSLVVRSCPREATGAASSAPFGDSIALLEYDVAPHRLSAGAAAFAAIAAPQQETSPTYDESAGGTPVAADATIGAGTTEGGYASFAAAKNALGSPGAGSVWDHIVEQSQMNATRSGFLPQQIHNSENLQDVPAELNQIKANYYSSIQPFSESMTVRNWLNGQSFEDQWNFGMSVTQDIWNGAIP